MKIHRTRVFVAGAAVFAIGICAEMAFSFDQPTTQDPVNAAISRGLQWLVSTQGKDGGWGQDGGETSYVRVSEQLESTGNDVANTAVAAEALLHTGTTPTHGPYREQLVRAVDFVLQHMEKSPAEGLAVTDLRGTQIQRKLGPYIDTFLAAKMLAELDGNMGTTQSNARVRANLQRCVAKIERNQLRDGSWNIAGGWAPILGTSLASQSLAIAATKGVADTQVALEKVGQYTVRSAAEAPATAVYAGGGMGAGIGSGMSSTSETISVSAGVPLYSSAQQLEQLSRTAEDRKKNAAQIQAIGGQLANESFVTGYGSIGGEEFFSWLNVSESLHRTGGEAWEKWNSETKARLLKIQNQDGTWAGQHCITGRVAVTSAAILLLTADRESVPNQTKTIRTGTKN